MAEPIKFEFEDAIVFLEMNDIGDVCWDAFGERLEGMFNQNIWLEAAYILPSGMEEVEPIVQITIAKRIDVESTILFDVSKKKVELAGFKCSGRRSFWVYPNVFRELVMKLMWAFERP